MSGAGVPERLSGMRASAQVYHNTLSGAAERVQGQLGAANALLYAWSPSQLMPVLLTVDAAGNLAVTGSGGGGGGGAVTVADGADVAEGATADAAVTSDTAGTLSAKLRGLVKILASVWDSVNGRLKVDGSAVTQPVSGTFWQSTQPVSVSGSVAVGNFPATQPVSAAALPLPTGAATETTLAAAKSDLDTIAGNTSGVAKDSSLANLANLDVAFSTRLKPADTLAGVTTLGTITNPVAVTQSGAWAVLANAGTNLNTSALALESGGNLAALVVAPATDGSGGISGPVIQGVVNDTPETWLTGEVRSLSLTTEGRLRVSSSVAFTDLDLFGCEFDFGQPRNILTGPICNPWGM